VGAVLGILMKLMELAAIFFNIFIFNMLAWSYISSSLEFNRAQVCDGVGLF